LDAAKVSHRSERIPNDQLNALIRVSQLQRADTAHDDQHRR